MKNVKKNTIIIGAAGRDFHNFNTYFRDNEQYDVKAFTAAQIPDIADRKYPAELAGKLYPGGIPIFAETELPNLIQSMDIDVCVFAYSDLPYGKVMNISAIVNAAGADFLLLGPNATQIKSTKPMISVCAVRTGTGKSQTSRRIIEILVNKGLRVVAIRHPMPYGDLLKQKVQRFATVDDLAKHKCTIEEMEEYEPHVVTKRNVIYAGVDYEAILREAEVDPDGCDVIVWDGGNNDFSFYKPDLSVAVVDPLRPGTEISYYPGEVVARTADVVIINKIDSASLDDINTVRKNISDINPKAVIVDAVSYLTVDKPERIKNKRVLVVEDGPTLTHGEMKFGAGTVAAKKHNAMELVDPRPYIVGKLKDTYNTYPGIGLLLPAMGYGEQQIKDLEKTIENTPCDAVVIGTPIDLQRIVKIKQPCVKIGYELQEIGFPNLDLILDEFICKHNLK